MKTASVTAILYGALVAIGGVMGYVNKGSVASIVSGGACGLVLIGCGFAMRGAGSSRIAWWASLVVTLAILGRFGPAFLRTGHWMPAGITAGLSILALIGLFVGRQGQVGAG